VDVVDDVATFNAPADAYDAHIGRYGPALAAALLDVAEIPSGARALDVGCGPGALTTALAGRLGASRVAAVDPSEPFVAACHARVPRADVRTATAEALPFADASFGAVLSQLVVNFLADAPAGVAEMARVTAPGGRVVVLEITTPQRPPLSWFFRVWFDRVVPALGRVAGDSDAYSYLPSSVRRFPGPSALAAKLVEAGLTEVRWVLTAGGIIAVHVGTKP
jgi:demethylmenaquinone methyltransferase / 2-methoxy-6-polyprenyl-1,4-benzoquinol methylase